MRWAAAALLVCAGMAAADPPPPGYFAGVYERVGRTGDAAPALIRDFVRLVPEGEAVLRLMPCDDAAPAVGLPAGGLRLRPDRFGDVANLLSTADGQPWLGCQYFNDMNNYPIMACHGGDGSLITLWPANEFGTCPPAP